MCFVVCTICWYLYVCISAFNNHKYWIKWKKYVFGSDNLIAWLHIATDLCSVYTLYILHKHNTVVMWYISTLIRFSSIAQFKTSNYLHQFWAADEMMTWFRSCLNYHFTVGFRCEWAYISNMLFDKYFEMTLYRNHRNHIPTYQVSKYKQQERKASS